MPYGSPENHSGVPENIIGKVAVRREPVIVGIRPVAGDFAGALMRAPSLPRASSTLTAALNSWRIRSSFVTYMPTQILRE
ncbi:hypothetical protein [Agrobacterium tumefaciens]|uniref:hypothetical protein n=1 Tax=Agrobacterium tumefaciens TaxID=358 RepID=UPI00396A3A86